MAGLSTNYDYFDYLDRLCEVYLTTYPGGETLSASSGGKGSKSAKLLVLGPKIQMARKGKRIHFTQKQLETLIAKARAAERKTRSKTGKLLASKGGSSTQSAGANELVLELLACMAMNRSVYGYVAQSNEPNRYSYDGWQQKDQYKNEGNGGLDLVRVQIDGPGIDEHLGFARSEGSSSQPLWKRYA